MRRNGDRRFLIPQTTNRNFAFGIFITITVYPMPSESLPVNNPTWPRSSNGCDRQIEAMGTYSALRQITSPRSETACNPKLSRCDTSNSGRLDRPTVQIAHRSLPTCCHVQSVTTQELPFLIKNEHARSNHIKTSVVPTIFRLPGFVARR